MRILHYSLGLPPYRSGGLTTFCTDLMKQQIRDGHTVALLWPGRMGGLSKETRIKDGGGAIQGDCRIRNYEIAHPLPVPYDEGIKDFDAFQRDGGAKAYAGLIDAFRPDVIHVHTFMGLHKSFLTVAREKGVRLVFSAHDFFPICSKVTLFRNGRVCESARDCADCGVCNATALSMLKTRVLQSVPYRTFKDSGVVRMLRKNHRDGFLSEETGDVPPVGTASDYLELRAHYRSMLELFDCVHYNSTLTKSVYEAFMPGRRSQVIPISHAGIDDHRREKRFSDKNIRIRYLGPCSKGKGYFRLREALDKLWLERQNFRLDVHFDPAEKAPYMAAHARYAYSELESIFDQTDVLIVPSVWYETFGYTVLEALSYGVPVVLSDSVGARDIVVEGAGIVFSGDGLYDALRRLDADKLRDMNGAILSKQTIVSLKEMAGELARRCYLA